MRQVVIDIRAIPLNELNEILHIRAEHHLSRNPLKMSFIKFIPSIRVQSARGGQFHKRIIVQYKGKKQTNNKKCTFDKTHNI